MKNNLELVQELLETRLNSLNEKIDTNNKNVLEVLGFIREQTTKTNGRVTILETRLNTLALDEAKHVLTCPRLADIKELSEKFDKFAEENFIVKVFNKYPKQFAAIIIGGIIITIITLGYGVWQGHQLMTESSKTEVQKTLK